MKNDIQIRQAGPQDRDFVIEAIIEAEKSGSQMISYCQLLGITEDELRTLLNNILDEEMDGQELCIPNFLIAEVDGEQAAAVSTWIEGAGGMTSNLIKANFFMYFLGSDVMHNAAGSLKVLSETNIERKDGALQIECVYTREKFRGMGLSGHLINEHIAWRKGKGETFDTAQVIVLKDNVSAIRSYEKAGFSVVAEKKSSRPEILKILPCDTKVMLERKLS